MQKIEAVIGDGVVVKGPEDLIREAMGVPPDVLDVPSFLHSLADSMRENVTLDHVDALFGDAPPPLPGLRDEEMANAVVELACRVKAVEESLAEPQPELDRTGRCACGRFLVRVPAPAGPVLMCPRCAETDAPRYAPSARVWDVSTGAGPWVLIAPGTLEIPVELPPAPGDMTYNADSRLTGDRPYGDYDGPVYRKVTVNAWVVETDPWTFKMVPEACLTDAAPLRLTEAMLKVLEQESTEEAADDLSELVCREEVRRLRMRAARDLLFVLLVGGVVVAPAVWWIYQHIL